MRSDGGGATSTQSGGFELLFTLPFTREEVWTELTLTLALAANLDPNPNLTLTLT